MNNLPSIIARNIIKTFGRANQSRTVIDDVNLSLIQGDMTLLMGPSGSGKSTLISMLSGLQKPDKGSIYFQNEDLYALKNKALTQIRAKYFGFVFQNTALFDSLTAHQQVTIPLMYLGVDKQKANYQADRVLHELDIVPLKRLRPPEMSGGEKQRVAIARMLAKEPAVIFADEPTSSLDSENSYSIAKLLNTCAKAYQATVLCVTHDERLTSYADKIIRIEDGKLQGA